MDRIRGSIAVAALLGALGSHTAGCSLARSLDDLPCQGDGDCTESRCVEQVCTPCPADTRLVRFEDGTAFCIDQFEVTQAQYWTFLQQVVGHPGLDHDQIPETCGTNFSYDPGADGCAAGFDPTAASSAHLPVVCIDYCDARAYCAWAGKRLCGGRGGGPLDPKLRGNLADDEWELACTDGKAARNVVLDKLPAKCNVNSTAPSEVGGSTDCHTDAGIFDIVGNVSEWTEACNIRDGHFECLARGGSFAAAQAGEAGCRLSSVPHHPAVERLSTIGLRCCLD